ncbi:MAG TPA: hypothetical protein PKM73_21330, partial [Verrucomicrobiota bacterium]|nr:hypothetical protein [Verrucomicrobiota bacterium]
MKTNTEAKKEQTPKTTTAPAAAPAQNGKAKAPKAKKDPAPKVEKETDTEPVDRLPTTVAELKESKSGLVTFLFLSGKD